ncbi:hypothetical protein GIB67_005311 [Kingdonia uniflora]|uniref:DUF7812 domain-containing protein n=1 Tax=Kingdonia uniflora TaxID=39325 RepID=A0A7J7MGL0_9MAGN|nr:hypothetical protein GIB67_005311 [Kingdonia uniflora]
MTQKDGCLPEVFRKLLDSLDSRNPEVLNPPFLKTLYYVLVQFSFDSSLDDSDFTVRSRQFGFSVNFSDVCSISNFLFDKLLKGFEQLFFRLGLVPVNAAFQQTNAHSKRWGSLLELTLLLRCSMVLLLLLEFDQKLLSDKCQILLMILRKLCSPDTILHFSRQLKGNRQHTISFKRSVVHEYTYAFDDGFTYFMEEFDDALTCYVHQSASPIPSTCSILEVFMDELLVHRQLRHYFMIVDNLSCTNEKLFVSHLIPGDSDAVLEVLAAHFLLLVSDESSFEKFLNKLFQWHREETLFDGLSLTAAMQLIGNSVLLSAPQVFQVYAISLVSRCFWLNMAPGNQTLDPKLTSRYLSVFERSVILYTRHLSSLQLDRAFHTSTVAEGLCDKRLDRGFGSSFDSCIQGVTYGNISLQVTKLADPWHHPVSETKSDLKDALVLYVKQNEHIIEDCHRDEIVSFVNFIISRTLYSGQESTLLTNSGGEVTQEDIVLLASMIDLMSSSLLQTVQSGCQKTLNENSCFKEYEFIIGIISCFRQFSISPPIRKLLSGAAKHKESKLMLIHFVDLLLYSFAKGLEVLRNGCIFMIMTLMNLFIFQEGNLDEVKTLFCCHIGFLSPHFSDEVPQLVVMRPSSFRIASKIQKIKMINLRTDASERILLLKDVEESILNKEDDKTCNGKTYMQLRMKGHRKPFDFDDVVDFIECKQEKNYSSWLKDRAKYRNLIFKRRSVLKKKRSCNSMKRTKVGDILRRFQ